ncbi:hypothetical protein [Streptomyces nigrescens]|uniref:hypothetical protein n=1 Tax=Streptomyces nigrescens TaxID=1920 RepID=UPI003697C968
MSELLGLIGYLTFLATCIVAYVRPVSARSANAGYLSGLAMVGVSAVLTHDLPLGIVAAASFGYFAYTIFAPRKAQKTGGAR